MGFWESQDKHWVIGAAVMNLWAPKSNRRKTRYSPGRATASKAAKAAPWAACALALLLVWAASFSRTWHVLEFKTLMR